MSSVPGSGERIREAREHFAWARDTLGRKNMDSDSAVSLAHRGVEICDDAAAALAAAEEARDEARRYVANVIAAHPHVLEQEAALVRTQEALRRAAVVAENLMGMIDQETWRATGGDDGQGHYEGDYRAEQLAEEIVGWRALAAGGEREPCGACAACLNGVSSECERLGYAG